MAENWCTTEWVERQLRTTGALLHGAVRSISITAMFPETAGSFSSTMSMVTIAYSDDARGARPDRALLKVSKPAFWQGGRSEALFYRFVLAHGVAVSTPRCFGVEIAEDQQQSRLLLEYVEGDHLHLDWDQGERPDVTSLLRMLSVLAELHAGYWGIDALPDYERVPMGRSLIDALDRDMGLGHLAQTFIDHHQQPRLL